MLTEKERGEIAIKILDYRFEEKGIRISPSEKRNFYNIANLLRISHEAADRFILKRIGSLLNATFHTEVKLSELDSELEGKIAFVYVKYLLRKEGMKFTEITNREIERISKKIDEPFSNLSLFFRDILVSLTDELFGPER